MKPRDTGADGVHGGRAPVRRALGRWEGAKSTRAGLLASAGVENRRDPGHRAQSPGPEHAGPRPDVERPPRLWKVGVLAQTGLSFDLSTASGELMRTIMAGLAEFERDLIRDRVKSGLYPLIIAESSEQ
jgi:hypothetical protein